ncbi:MAG: hypothetical protein ACOX8R_10385 [Bacillota bacterium]|jgi:hypothetical protein
MTTDKTNEKDTEEKLERMWDGFKSKPPAKPVVCTPPSRRTDSSI